MPFEWSTTRLSAGRYWLYVGTLGRMRPGRGTAIMVVSISGGTTISERSYMRTVPTHYHKKTVLEDAMEMLMTWLGQRTPLTTRKKGTL